MTVGPLSCTVRGCGRPLQQHGRGVVCGAGHAFDVARSGYLNLLQPDDRRSERPGDTRAAVEARARLMTAGAGAALLDAVMAAVGAFDLAAGAVVVDLGSGSGDHLAAIAERFRIAGIGIDLSTAAATHAARQHPALTWVVANADRRLPLLDGSVDLALSLHARRNPPECARVLGAGRRLLVSVPAPDDLVELREAVQGRRVERDRAAAVIAEHAAWFSLSAHTVTRQRRRFERGALRDLLAGTYRGERTRHAARVDALHSLDVTLASDVLVFTRR